MSDRLRSVEVHADWVGLEGTTRLGTLFVQETRGRDIFSFEYDDAWLRRDDNRVLDPDLRLYKGPQYVGMNKPNFGLFLDSSPDRWGRVLMRRREAILARKEGRTPKRLGDVDYLLGVNDLNRMGALRFRERGNDVFQSSDRARAPPPWSTLRDLEYASFLVERDVGAWELIAAELAHEVGIEMSECRLDSFSKRGSTFLTKRFDRVGTGRLHFASAMTLLGRKDGDDAEAGASYLELAEFIMRFGSRPEADLRQLWRRIVFSIAVSNTDDHLRNHGFILEEKGWRLSPAYDINRSPSMSTTIRWTSDSRSLSRSTSGSRFETLRRSSIRRGVRWRRGVREPDAWGSRAARSIAWQGHSIHNTGQL